VADGLNTNPLKAHLRWWLTTAGKTDEGGLVRRRINQSAQYHGAGECGSWDILAFIKPGLVFLESSTAAPRATYSPIDRHTAACQRFEAYPYIRTTSRDKGSPGIQEKKTGYRFERKCYGVYTCTLHS